MPKPLRTKFLAAFLLLFVCMNAGGAVCAAYCRTFVLSASKAHCPLPKTESHCNKAETAENDGTAVKAEKFDCCPMLVSFIPGTLEQKQNFNAAAAPIPAANIRSTAVVEINRYRFHVLPAYRGPPKDESVLHITNRTLRI